MTTKSPKTIKTPFTGDPKADALPENDGLALLIGMFLDHQIR